MGPKAKLTNFIKQFPELVEHFPEMPQLIYKALESAAQAQQNTKRQNEELALLRRQVEKSQALTGWMVVISSVIISLAILLQ